MGKVECDMENFQNVGYFVIKVGFWKFELGCGFALLDEFSKYGVFCWFGINGGKLPFCMKLDQELLWLGFIDKWNVWKKKFRKR
jgi:hypothetical protein